MIKQAINIQNFFSSKTLFGRKHSQHIYLTKDFYEKYINNFYKTTIKMIIINYIKIANLTWPFLCSL